jgi:hypothetical protein
MRSPIVVGCEHFVVQVLRREGLDVDGNILGETFHPSELSDGVDGICG